MASALLKRVFELVVVLFSISILVFLMQRLIPGGPVEVILGPDASAEQKLEWSTKYGFSDPLLVQLKNFIFNLIRLDFGHTYSGFKPIWEIIFPRFGATVILASVAFTLSATLSILIGVWCAVKESSGVDKFFVGLSIFMTGCPAYVAGPLLAWLFSVKLGWFPLTGNESWKSLVLPVATLSLALTTVTLRYVRVGVIDVLSEAYIRTAKAKGLSKFRVYFIHAFSNVLSNVLPVFGIQLGALLSGSVITEQVFAWPGLGSLLIESVQSREYNVVSACVIIVATLYVVCNTIADLLQLIVDPRLANRGL